jgi:hypothetical protein
MGAQGRSWGVDDAPSDAGRRWWQGGMRTRRDEHLTLPADIPESRFWSVILYDRQTRSMLKTDQPHPSLGSQSGTVETNADGTTTIYFGPVAPEGKENNWLQTVPGKGWCTVRLYNAPVVLRQDLATFRDRTDLTRHNHRLPDAGEDRCRRYTGTDAR